LYFSLFDWVFSGQANHTEELLQSIAIIIVLIVLGCREAHTNDGARIAELIHFDTIAPRQSTGAATAFALVIFGSRHCIGSEFPAGRYEIIERIRIFKNKNERIKKVNPVKPDSPSDSR
jgi:hypothetical protein